MCARQYLNVKDLLNEKENTLLPLHDYKSNHIMMTKVTIIHNPRCSTSRNILQMVEENGIETDTILYLQGKLKTRNLQSILKKLKLGPLEIIRKKEPLFVEQFQDKTLTDDEWIQVIVENPVLLERPILIKGQRAIIGRPVEAVEKFLKIKKQKV
ncbi:MAG: arsenate reductase (glutaredoxin) [Saprospiraceae bacterium]